jgi:hypothetical protein
MTLITCPGCSAQFEVEESEVTRSLRQVSGQPRVWLLKCNGTELHRCILDDTEPRVPTV